MTTISYEPLDSDRKELRLLRLPYEASDDNLGIKMFTTWLGSQPEYLAMSYVWGDPHDKVSVSVGKGQVLVPRNLKDALIPWSRYAREVSRDVYLWADAICINQADLQEKSSQILLMNEIFTEATATAVWLGQGVGEHEHAFQAIQKYSTLSQSYSLRSFDLPTLMHDTWDAEQVRRRISPIKVGLGQGCDIKLQSIERFLSHPWWQRVWTFQEAALARQLIFSIGSHVLYRNDFSDFTFVLLLKHELLRSDPQAGNVSAAIKTVVSHLTVVNEQLKAGSKHERPLLKMLDMSAIGQRRCLDPRDHVFGIMGMIDKQDSAMETLKGLSYNHDDVAIFMTVAAQLLETHGVQMLEYTWPKCSPEIGHQAVQYQVKQDRLPSWVPNWSAKFSHPLQGAVTLRAKTHFTASSSFPIPSDPPFVKGCLLHVSGVEIEKISAIAPALKYLENITTLIPWLKQSWQPWMSACLTLLSDSKSYPSFRDKFFAIMRTAMRDCTDIHQALSGNRRIDMALDEEKLNDVLDTYRAITDPNVMKTITTQARTFLDRLEKQTWIVFVTQQGRLGLGRAGCKAGDPVYILAGASTCSILRPAEGHMNGDEGLRYRLIGEAYVHGMMDGQCRPEAPLTRLEIV